MILVVNSSVVNSNEERWLDANDMMMWGSVPIFWNKKYYSTNETSLGKTERNYDPITITFLTKLWNYKKTKKTVCNVTVKTDVTKFLFIQLRNVWRWFLFLSLLHFVRCRPNIIRNWPASLDPLFVCHAFINVILQHYFCILFYIGYPRYAAWLSDAKVYFTHDWFIWHTYRNTLSHVHKYTSIQLRRLKIRFEYNPQT